MSRPTVSSSTYTRDPVSVLLDRGARKLLERAYATPGRWVSTRLADPTPAHVSHFAAQGIDVTGPDPAARKINAHTRWARGFMRSIYYQHLWHSNVGGRGWRADRRMTERKAGALQVDIGRHMPELGVIPAGRVVRVILHPGGQAALRAAQRAPAADRIFSADGSAPGGAAADAGRRDW